jgi:hypothetical protein
VAGDSLVTKTRPPSHVVRTRVRTRGINQGVRRNGAQMANAPQSTTKRQVLTQVLGNHYPTILFASTQIIGRLENPVALVHQ